MDFPSMPQTAACQYIRRTPGSTVNTDSRGASSTVSSSLVPNRSLMINAPRATRNDLAGDPWVGLNC